MHIGSTAYRRYYNTYRSFITILDKKKKKPFRCDFCVYITIIVLALAFPTRVPVVSFGFEKFNVWYLIIRINIVELSARFKTARRAHGVFSVFDEIKRPIAILRCTD